MFSAFSHSFRKDHSTFRFHDEGKDFPFFLKKWRQKDEAAGEERGGMMRISLSDEMGNLWMMCVYHRWLDIKLFAKVLSLLNVPLNFKLDIMMCLSLLSKTSSCELDLADY